MYTCSDDIAAPLVIVDSITKPENEKKIVNPWTETKPTQRNIWS